MGSRDANLSDVAVKLLSMDSERAYTRLVVTGDGSHAARALLEGAGPHDLLSAPSRDQDCARGMLAGLWLWHDWLDESHALSQSITSPVGSYWHAIMHRREGDFSNSKYWYSKCRGHPGSSLLADQAKPLLDAGPPDPSLGRVIAGGWNSDALVDLVAEVHNRPDDPRHPVAVRLQQLEWRALFDHCVRNATA